MERFHCNDCKVFIDCEERRISILGYSKWDLKDSREIETPVASNNKPFRTLL